MMRDKFTKIGVWFGCTNIHSFVDCLGIGTYDFCFKNKMTALFTKKLFC